LNELLNKLLERSNGQKIAILAAVIILLAALYYSFLFDPHAIAKLADEVEIARNEGSKKQLQAANLPRLQKELAELDAKLKQAVVQLPNRKEMADLLNSISNKA
jgi:Tfp pilus assembly protein PilO